MLFSCSEGEEDCQQRDLEVTEFSVLPHRRNLNGMVTGGTIDRIPKTKVVESKALQSEIDQTVSCGNCHAFKCQIKGGKRPTDFNWFHMDQRLIDKGEYDVEIRNDPLNQSSILILYNVKMESEGNYLCIAVDSSNKDFLSHYHLTVTESKQTSGKPRIKSLSYKAGHESVNIEGFDVLKVNVGASIVIQCEADEQAHGCQYPRFQIERNSSLIKDNNDDVKIRKLLPISPSHV